jgi:hypothetical protein
MIRFLKAAMLSIIVLLTGANVTATEPATSAPSTPEIIVERETVSLSRRESRIRNSAVKVASPNGSGYGSGTYSVISGKHVVITAAHVVRDNPFMAILGRSGEIVFGNVAYMDIDRDVAILVVPELQSRTPIAFRPSRQSQQELVGDRVYYTGFPNHHDLFSVRAYISGIESRQGGSMLLMNGYAWMGASGSGIFDSSGDFVGTLVAVDVGVWRQPQIVETVVWISPVSNFDIRSIEEHIRYYKSEIPEYQDR